MRRVLLGWLSIELGAGILALCLIVALLPLVILLLPRLWGESTPAWAVAVTVLSVSIPSAILLGLSAVRAPLNLGP